MPALSQRICMTMEIWYALYKVITLPIILTILLCWRVTSCVMVATATLIAGISSSSTKMMKLLCFLSKRVYICDLSLVQSKNFIKDSHPVKAANCIRKATWPFQIKQSSTKSSSKASKSKPCLVISRPSSSSSSHYFLASMRPHLMLNMYYHTLLIFA